MSITKMDNKIKVSIVLNKGKIESIHSDNQNLQVVVVDYDNLPNYENPVCSDHIQEKLLEEHNTLAFSSCRRQMIKRTL